MQARLLVYRNDKQEFCVPVNEPGSGIGRDSGNHVQLPSPEVSKRHAFLQHTQQGWHIQDLNSRNGTFVNGKKVTETILNEGDRLLIGPYVLIFEIAGAAYPYTPKLQIDVSPKTSQQTMQARRPR